MEQKKILEKLHDNANFSGFNKLDLLNIIKYAYYRSCRKEMSLYYQGEPAETVFLIISGTI